MSEWHLSAITVLVRDSATGQQWSVPVDLTQWGGLFWKSNRTYLEKHLGWTDRHFRDEDRSARMWDAHGNQSFILVIKDPICEEGPFPFPDPARIAGHEWSFDLELVVEDGEGSAQKMILSQRRLERFAGMLWDVDAVQPRNSMLRPFAKELLDQRQAHPGLFRSAAGMLAFLDFNGQPVPLY